MAGTPPTMFPFVRFADADAAIEWLGRAFGFAEHAVYRTDDGVVHHAELALGNGMVMLGQGDPESHGVYLAIEGDVDEHCARAREAGAEILRGPEDTPYGSREYTARDPDGHVWSFGSYNPYRYEGE